LEIYKMANTYKKDWKEALGEIRTLDEEYKRVGMTWNNAGLDAYTKKRNSLRKEYKELILDGASQELIKKVETAQKARALFLEEKRKESESWNSEKLVSEYGITRVMLDMVTVGVDAMSGDLLSNRIDKLYKEVKDSQSKYKYRAIVEGVNLVSKHTKPNAKAPQGGIIKREAPVHISNLMLIDPTSGKPTRVGKRLNEKEKLVRYSKKSGEEIK